MRLLIDTATFIWATEATELLSRKASRVLHDESISLEMSALSLTELAIKRSSGKLNLDKSDILTGLSNLRVHVLPYTVEHAWRMFGLPLHHKDPFDRQLIATALAEKIPIVTPDRAFRDYEGLEVIW